MDKIMDNGRTLLIQLGHFQIDTIEPALLIQIIDIVIYNYMKLNKLILFRFIIFKKCYTYNVFYAE